MPKFNTPTPPFTAADYEMPRMSDNDNDKVSRQKNIDAINANFIAEALDRAELAALWSADFTYDENGTLTKTIMRYANTQLAARAEYEYEDGTIGGQEQVVDGQTVIVGAWPIQRLKAETRSYSTDYAGDETAATWQGTGTGSYLYNAIGNIIKLNWSQL